MDIQTIVAIITVVVVFSAAVIAGFIYFVKLPKEQKIKNLKEWLKWAVVEAEKALGSGTGQLKLRMVYDMAAQKFPWIVTLISFDLFSKWVDEALDWMRKQLSENNAAAKYVKE